MDIQDNTGFMAANKFHKHGDKLPCLKGNMIVRGECFEIAVWPPKEGKKAYFIKVTPKADAETAKDAAKSGQPSKPSVQPVQPISTPKPIKPSSLFKK